MSDSSEFPTQYRVSPWEVIAVLGGAVFLVAVGVAGLGIKATNNAFDPNRAEAIAQSMMRYEIPSGSRGLFGTNLGSGRIAVVGSQEGIQAPVDAVSGSTTQLPKSELFLARIPIDEKTDPPNTELDLLGNQLFFNGFSFSYQMEGAFQVKTTHTENHRFCDATVPVKIEEGTLTLADQRSTVPAARYEVSTERDADTYIAIISTLGENARSHAESVFRSLKCEP